MKELDKNMYFGAKAVTIETIVNERLKSPPWGI